MPWCSLLGYPYQGGSRALVFASWIPPSAVTSCLGSLLGYPHWGFVPWCSLLGYPHRGFSCLGVRCLDTPMRGFSCLGSLLGYPSWGVLVPWFASWIPPIGGFSCLGLLLGYGIFAPWCSLLGYPYEGVLVPWFASWMPLMGGSRPLVRFLDVLVPWFASWIPASGASCLCSLLGYPPSRFLVPWFSLSFELISFTWPRPPHEVESTPRTSPFRA